MAFPTGWGRKCSVTIDNTKVSGSANHSDFPVLITEDNLPSEMFDADGSYPARSDGGDIRFTSDEAGTTELAREVVEFTTDNDPANGTAQIWVKVPTLDYNDDTVIYVWYNAPSETEPASDSTYGSEAVWSDYTAVWHLEENGSTYKDSTGDNDSTGGTDPDQVSAKIGKGQDFDDASSEYIELTDIDIGTTYTLSIWFNGDSDFTSGSFAGLIGRFNADGNVDEWTAGLFVYDNKNLAFGFGNGSSFAFNAAIQTLTSGTDYKIDVVYNGTLVKFYINGAYVSGEDIGTTLTPISTANKWNLGTSEGNGYLDGILDEARIQNGTAKTVDWIATEYANQNAPADFASAGTPSSTTTTNIKSINGVAYADIKSVNGVAIADVKSINNLE